MAIRSSTSITCEYNRLRRVPESMVNVALADHPTVHIGYQRLVRTMTLPPIDFKGRYLPKTWFFPNEPGRRSQILLPDPEAFRGPQAPCGPWPTALASVGLANEHVGAHGRVGTPGCRPILFGHPRAHDNPGSILLHRCFL
eukprot:scaffold236868_cov23-Tisochrysis_lutea.AAC.2